MAIMKTTAPKKAAAKKAVAKKPGAKKPAPGKTAPVKKARIAKEAGGDASAQIDARITSLGDWRGEMLAKLRAVILSADPSIVEEWKWEVPVWSSAGIICTGESYKKAVKLTFSKGASLPDPSKLFNASLEGNTRRAIDFTEGAKVNEKALKALIVEAVKLNLGGKKT